MNQIFIGLTRVTSAAWGSWAVYTDLLSRRIRDFLLVSRNAQRLDDFSKEIISEQIDEILAVVPAAKAPNFYNTFTSPVEQFPQQMASPFGDW